MSDTANHNACDYTIEQLLPHDHPMILIDRATSADEQQLTAAVEIREASLFYDAQQNGIPSWVGMEMMAQAIAAFAGYQELKHNKPVKKGFLLGTRKYHSDLSVFPLGQQYTVTVEKQYQEENGLGAFKCSMHHQQLLIASANIKVFSPPDVDAFIQQQIEQGNHS